MAHSVTVQTIVDEVQVLTEDPLHKLATEAQYISRLSRHASRLHRMYVEAEPDRYRTEATITAGTGGTDSYALPALWLGTIGVDYANGNQRTPLVRLQEENRNDYIGQTGVSRAFRLLTTNIHLYPTPVTEQASRTSTCRRWRRSRRRGHDGLPAG
jgi:hypothetical protein